MELEHPQLGILVDEEPNVMGEIQLDALLIQLHFIQVVINGVECAEPGLVDEIGGLVICTVFDVPVLELVRYRFPIGRVS